MNKEQIDLLHPVWHEEIKFELEHRDKECKRKKGPHQVYTLKKQNPYTYKNLMELNKRMPFERSDCRFQFIPSTQTDEANRYYKHFRTEAQCKSNGNSKRDGALYSNIKIGEWSKDDINRYNKYDDGVCWVSEIDKECGSLGNTELLRPSKVKQFIREGVLDEKLNDLENKCIINDKCKVAQISKFSYDCVDNKKFNIREEKIVGFPSDFPFDITNKNNNVEEILYNWYVLGKFKKPKVTDLIGEGNRCISKAKENDKDSVEKDYFSFPSKHVDALKLDEVLDLDFSLKENEDQFFNTLEKYYNIVDKEVQKKFLSTLKKTKNGKYYIKRRLESEKFDNDDEVNLDRVETNPLFGVPSVPQSIVNMLMKNMARNPRGTNRGIMAWFSTGAGKTICATGVMDAFWDTDKQIIFASSLDALASNPESSFYEAALIFPRFQSNAFISETKEKTLENIGNEFKRRKVRFLSFAKLSNRVKKTIEYKKTIKQKMGGGVDKSLQISDDNYVDLDNSILIIDEVHNLFRPEFNQAKEHKYLENELLNPLKHPKLKLTILTATPGDNIPDIVKLLNMIRDTKNPPITIPDPDKDASLNKFKEEIRGLVSYFNMNGDRTKFPIVTETAHNYANMSEKQYERYKEALTKDTKANLMDFDKLEKDNASGKYYNPPRKYANTLYNFEAGIKQVEFSAKMPLVISKLKLFPKDKHYLYSAFYERRGYGGHGVIAIGKELEKIGYTKFTVADAVKFNKSNTVPPPGKRYILAIAKEIEEGRKGFSVGQNLKELLNIYNHAGNKNGELIHVMLASNKFNEGIDLKAVKHIHFFEPLVTMASDKQTIGRAARNCSHAHLDQADWTVKIHRYLTNLPIENEFNQVNIDTVKQEQKELERNLSELEASLNAAVKENKATIRANIKELKADIKVKTAQIKKHEKDNKQKIINVEKKIFAESRERMKGILTVYHAMREAAVDCRVMEKFHSTSENPVRCMH